MTSMTGSATFDVLTIGHSNVPAEDFIALLKNAGVTAIADVRSVPFSRRFPWFSAKALVDRLQSRGIAYSAFGPSLGGRPDDVTLYCDGVADYEAMAATADFRTGLDQVLDGARQHRLCLMCAEREPLDCHRCLLVGRALVKRGCSVGHILGNGQVEPHVVTEDRLLVLAKVGDELFHDRGARLAEAYRRRNRAVASRLSDRVRPRRRSGAFMPS
jgi:uncharacterized protein (DUF488 family)